MTSKITDHSVNIDATYPIAGVNQSSQGFRTNFDAAKRALTEAATEVSNLQLKKIQLSGDATGTSAELGEGVTNTSLALTLATVLSTPGEFSGDIALTADGKGRITAISATPITTDVDTEITYEPNVTGMGSGTGSVLFPAFKFDSRGRVAEASMKTISFGLLNQTLERGRMIAGGVGSVSSTVAVPTFSGNEVLVASGDGVTGLIWRTLTKADVGLVNADNTSDADKPVSTAQQTALDLKANLSGADFGGALRINSTSTAPATGSGLELRYGSGTSIIQSFNRDTETYETLFIKGSSIQFSNDDGETLTWSVSGLTVSNTISANSYQGDGSNLTGLTKTQVGLANVDNTSDADKPVSTATQTALDGKQNKTLTVTTQTVTTYNLVLSDAGGFIQLDDATGVGLVIPTEAAVAFPIGTIIRISQIGAGAVTITGDTGVVVNSRGSNTNTAGQWSVATLVKTAADTWNLSGDITT